MSLQQPPAVQDKYLADFQALQSSMAGGQPEWARDVRHRALARFGEMGFPTSRRGNEKWKYTNVAPVANQTFEYPSVPKEVESNPQAVRRLGPWDNDWVSLVFIDGHYCGTFESHPNGLKTSNLAEAFRGTGSVQDVAEKHLARYASFEDDAFTALNTAFVKDGALVHCPEGHSASSPVHLLHVATNRTDATVSHPRTLIVADPNSKLTVVESYIGLSRSPYLTNAVTEIAVGDGARVEHYQLLMDSPGAFHVGSTRVYQRRDSTFTSTGLFRGAAVARNDLSVVLDNEGSSCTLGGLYMTSGTEHIDNNINVDHAKPHTTSRLYYKGILDGSSRAVFGGTVLVREGAQKADAQQSDKNLLLSDDAEVNSKPSLLIYADDVKCAHGATAGHIDEDALFYMRSRGLDLPTANRLLVHAFANEIIEGIQLQAFREYVDRMFLNALPDFRPGS